MKSGSENGKAGFLEAFYKFTRPHTIRGTILASCACVTRVTIHCIQTQSIIEWSLLRTAVFGLMALLCGNAYIVGINQIYDVDIDKVSSHAPYPHAISARFASNAAAKSDGHVPLTVRSFPVVTPPTISPSAIPAPPSIHTSSILSPAPVPPPLLPLPPTPTTPPPPFTRILSHSV